MLDLNCRAHDLDNLYVVDGSFFISSDAVNPTLTIIANALSIGDHLRERMSVKAASHNWSAAGQKTTREEMILAKQVGWISSPKLICAQQSGGARRVAGLRPC